MQRQARARRSFRLLTIYAQDAGQRPELRREDDARRRHAQRHAAGAAPRERQRVLVDRALAVRNGPVGELVRRRRPQPQLRRRPQEADLRREGRARRREEGQRRDGPRQRGKTGEPGRHEDRAGHVQVDAPRAAVRDVVDDFCSAVASSAAELERYRRACW